MPIEELQEPYWEKQEGETPNQYCYFLEFLEFPTFNLKDFHQHLCEKSKREQKGAFETESGLKVENVGKCEPSGPEM